MRFQTGELEVGRRRGEAFIQVAGIRHIRKLILLSSRHSCMYSWDVGRLKSNSSAFCSLAVAAWSDSTRGLSLGLINLIYICDRSVFPGLLDNALQNLPDVQLSRNEMELGHFFQVRD